MEFNFNRVFEQESTQEELFDNVAKPVILKYGKYLSCK